MQAAGIDAFGGEVKMIELAAPPSPAPDDVVIAAHAAGLGNWDEIVRLGDWDVGRRPPLALGVEAAGVIDVVGERVTTLVPGDRCSPIQCRSATRVPGLTGSSLPAALVAPKPAVVASETVRDQAAGRETRVGTTGNRSCARKRLKPRAPRCRREH